MVTGYSFAYIDRNGQRRLSEYAPSLNLLTGELSFTLPENHDSSTFYLIPVDNGSGLATCAGENALVYSALIWLSIPPLDVTGNEVIYPPTQGPCGFPQELTLVVGDRIAAQLGLSRVPVRTRASSRGLGSNLATYELVVRNTGGVDITGARLLMPRPSGTTTLVWSCVENATACQTSSGMGAVSTLLNLAMDQSLVVEVAMEVPDSADALQMQPRIEFAEGVEGVEGYVFNNRAVRTDAVSSSHVFEPTSL